jgi:hypothetical protein
VNSSLALSPVSFAGRVAVTYVQGSPKGVGAPGQRGEFNTRLGPPLLFFGEVPVFRKFLFFFEIALLGLLQVIGFASAVIGLFPALAHTPSPSEAAFLSETAQNDANIVQDFMAALPPSDLVKPLYKGGPQPSDQTLYRNNQNFVVAHRFYHDKKRGGRETAEMIAGIFASFTTECEAKGGYIENHDRGTFAKTFSRLNSDGFDSKMREQDLKICMRTRNHALGAIAVQSSTTKAPLVSLRTSIDNFTVVALHPTIVATQSDLDSETAAANEQWRRNEEKGKREQAELESWRRSITVGTETSCGPVLQSNGDLFEIAYYQTREPKWYRRSELWPTPYNLAGFRTCN